MDCGRRHPCLIVQVNKDIASATGTDEWVRKRKVSVFCIAGSVPYKGIVCSKVKQSLGVTYLIFNGE